TTSLVFVLISATSNAAGAGATPLSEGGGLSLLSPRNSSNSARSSSTRRGDEFHHSQVEPLLAADPCPSSSVVQGQVESPPTGSTSTRTIRRSAGSGGAADSASSEQE
ncbi:unnamed protein product, partial [Amoebophrya sp. A120]